MASDLSCYNHYVAADYLYLPLKYLDSDNKKPLIFLGGPIQGADNWQSEAIKIIHDLDIGVVIASPRREYMPDDFDYNEQVDWESVHLKRAGNYGVVMFWLAKETDHTCDRSYAQTTRAELFEWKVRHEVYHSKLVVGIEDGFSGARYIQRRFSQDCPDVPIVSSLEECCRKAVELIRSQSGLTI